MNNNNTKQSEETKNQLSVFGNPALSGESIPENLLTVHPDGRVTTSDRLKPDETAALALDQIKTQWLKDAQATKIRELQDRIKRLDGHIERLESIGDSLFDGVTRIEAEQRWRKAKEAKP